jgi:predicted anti-sigma-YlaC factor YlaD
MKRMKNNCEGMDAKLANLLLDPVAAPVEVREHIAECGRCRREMDELGATFSLLDSWTAPEPGPYFLTRLQARLQEERAAEPTGWFARLRSSFVYGPAAHVRPLAAMALTILLLVGGGAYLGMTDWNHPQATPAQAAVQDLQTMSSNAQLLDQLENISSNN